VSVWCADCREQLSARLDAEDDPGLRAAVEAHLAGCAECRAWFDDAARVTRLARTGVARPAPDLAGAVRARVPVAGRSWPRRALRLVVALAGLGQLALSAVELAADRVGATGASGDELQGASLMHFAHESAAWNLALGVGFVWVALRVRRAAGLVPTLTAFVLTLAVLTGLDYAHGRVDVVRLASHLLVVVGYAAVLALAAREAGGGGFFPRALRWPGAAPHPATGASAAPERGGRLGEGRGGGLRPTGRRGAA
jgi:predicted anti-sigma-YlaC factor YlaD